MTTTLLTTHVTLLPSVFLIPCTASPVAAMSTAAMSTAGMSASVSSATRASVVDVPAVDVPAIDGNWSRGRNDFGMANYGKTLDAPAAKHAKAVDPPRGTNV
ncbi:MAG: hypothetical protein JWN61_3006 [Pseudonocardiales bacterium]|nr:hypothetical protein [Pseudonocardiales bacterium]